VYAPFYVILISMPFTLAHPVAVLPLKRYCPRWLSLPALIIGSLSPDLSYALGEAGGMFGHQLLGAIAFCVPAGIVLVALFYVLRSRVARMFPEPYAAALLPLCQRPRSSVPAIVISLIIGAGTHVAWDSFTHNTGWCVENFPVLQTVVLQVGNRTARVCHLLWYGCSFLGVVWLFLVFEKWKQACVHGGAFVLDRAVMRDAALVAILVVPLQLVHHLIHDQKSGLYVIAALCALPAIGIILKMGSARKGAAATPPAAQERSPD
jgi:hypothetical protein